MGIKALEAGFSMALWDWWGQKFGRPVFELLSLKSTILPKTRYTISIGLASSGIIFFISSGYIETQTGAWNSILGVGALMILISGILKGVGASITQRIDEYSRGKIRE